MVWQWRNFLSQRIILSYLVSFRARSSHAIIQLVYDTSCAKQNETCIGSYCCRVRLSFSPSSRQFARWEDKERSTSDGKGLLNFTIARLPRSRLTANCFVNYDRLFGLAGDLSNRAGNFLRGWKPIQKTRLEFLSWYNSIVTTADWLSQQLFWSLLKPGTKFQGITMFDARRTYPDFIVVLRNLGVLCSYSKVVLRLNEQDCLSYISILCWGQGKFGRPYSHMLWFNFPVGWKFL